MKQRKPDFKIDDLFLQRWSPRAMSGEDISDEDLMSLFEAARWAPSAYNNQPWRFLYAKKKTEEWEMFFDLLIDFNKSWCKKASALVMVLSTKNFEYNGKTNPTHSFDTGSAWQNIALQGSIKGLVVHGMSGFDYEKARTSLNIPDDIAIEAMFAVGKPGNKKDLSKELQEKEFPSDRKKVNEFVKKGKWR